MSFQSDVTAAFDKFGQQLQQYTVRIANEAHASVVNLSPVDTGYFRAQWIYNPLEYPTINIRNNTVYGPRLEYGWSKQAPNGMVRVTVNGIKAKYG